MDDVYQRMLVHMVDAARHGDTAAQDEIDRLELTLEGRKRLAYLRRQRRNTNDMP